MSVFTPQRMRSAIEYPDTDGKPMAENTLQFQWIVTIKEGLETVFWERTDVFVAGDLFWYPVEGRPDIVIAPDAMVAFGRPKGHRGSYKQWEEAGLAPKVVFEVLSPGNRPREMIEKFKFYEKYGVDEYYIYDPDKGELLGYLRNDGGLQGIPYMDGWRSPALGIQFDLSGAELKIYGPGGHRFLTYPELAKQRDLATERAEREQERAEREQERADRLAAQLRTLGIEPEV